MAALALGTICAFSLQLAVLALSAWLAARVFSLQRRKAVSCCGASSACSHSRPLH